MSKKLKAKDNFKEKTKKKKDSKETKSNTFINLVGKETFSINDKKSKSNK